LKPQKIGVGGSIPRQLFPEERSVEEKWALFKFNHQ
jgi:hypothetical protein